MAQKTILTESEIRRFLKLADLKTVGNNRLEEMGYGAYTEDEEALEEIAPPHELEMDADDDLEDDTLQGDEEAMADEEEADLELGADDLDGEDAEEGPVDAESLVLDLLGRIEDWAEENGVAMDVEGGDEGDLEGGDEVVAIDGMDMDIEPDPEGGEALEIGDEDAIVANRDVSMAYEGKEDVVAEVARRVVARLTKQKHNEEIANQLAERILNRLTK